MLSTCLILCVLSMVLMTHGTDCIVIIWNNCIFMTHANHMRKQNIFSIRCLLVKSFWWLFNIVTKGGRHTRMTRVISELQTYNIENCIRQNNASFCFNIKWIIKLKGKHVLTGFRVGLSRWFNFESSSVSLNFTITYTTWDDERIFATFYIF